MTRHKTSSRLLAMLLSLILVIGILPASAFAIGTADDVVYIGNTGYPTLAQAVSQANPGDTILLAADDSTVQQIEIGQDLTIELDGHSLPNTAFKITAGAVTIGDRKGTGSINGNHAAGFVATENTRCSSSIYITGTAEVILNNLRVEQCAQDDLEKAIFLGGSASLTVNGGSYTGPKDPGVDAVFYYNNDTASSLTINDGYFEANCALSVNKTPGTGGGTLVICKATFVGNGTAFWIEQEYGGVTTQEDAERFLADSSGSYIVGSFDQANIVIGSGLFVSDGFTGPEYGSTDSDNPAELTPEDGDSITLLPQILGGDGSAYTYTWYKDSQVISGATGSSYTIESYQSPDDNGLYSVTVSQGSSSITLYWQVSGAVVTPQLPGEGTEQFPYEISTPEQLMAFAQLVNGGSSAAYAKLTDDIDMSGQSWAGISGNSDYTGVFDGQGHIISNLTGTEGLFVNNAGTVKNVQLKNVVLTKDGGNLGAVVGVNTGTVFNCVSSGSITGNGIDAYSIGGLIGHNNGGTLTGSASSCTVDGRTAGGLVGSNWQSSGGYGTITACIYTGNARKPVEGDNSYGSSTDVYYKYLGGACISYPQNTVADEAAALLSMNNYIVQHGGALLINGDGSTAPNTAVSYLEYTEDSFVTKYVQTYTVIDGENVPTEWNSGWYVVNGTVDISEEVIVSGTVSLILTDGSMLTCSNGINVSGENSLTIYGQTNGTGTLNAIGKAGGHPGIGAYNDAGDIAIHGGVINAAGSFENHTLGSLGSIAYMGSGIGGGASSRGAAETDNSVIIYGGTVTATGASGWSSGSTRRIQGIYAASFSTGTVGTAVIKVNGISDVSQKENWSGIIDDGSGIVIYGNQTLSDDLTINDGYSLTVSSGSKLTVPGGIALTNNGTLNVESSGSIVSAGSFINHKNVKIDGSVNCGAIQNSSLIEISETGTLICNGGTNTGIIYNNGVLTNTGTISGQGGVIFSDSDVAGAESQLIKDPYYLNEQGEITSIPEDHVLVPVTATASTWQKIDGKTTWYVAVGNVTIDGGVTLSDDINLLLMDGADLRINGRNDNGGINAANHILNVYAQSNGSGMGKLTANGGHYNWMAIGGENATVNIHGGFIDVSETSSQYAGIGAAIYRNSKEITVTGGLVKTQSIGKGDTVGNQTGGFYAPEGSNAIVYTNQTNIGNAAATFHGILFLQKTGTVYGNQELAMDLTIEYGEVLTVPAGTTWTIPSGVTLTVKGKLIVEGTLDILGTVVHEGTIENPGAIRVKHGGDYTGEEPTPNSVTYQIDWDTDGDDTVDDTTYVAYGETPSHVNGSKEPTLDTVYTFTGWTPEIAAVTGTATYKAQFSSGTRTYTVTVPTGEGYTIQYTDGTEVAYNNNFTFTLNIESGYSTTEEFAVMANGVLLSMNGEYNYTAIITGNTVITVEGIADTTAPSNLTVRYETNGFKEFLNTITFGLFFKDTVTVTITATDEGSGVKEISYQLGDDGELQTVETQNGKITFTVEPEFKGNIKNVTATDNAGNTSEGIDYEYFAVEKNKPADVTIDTNGYESGKWTNGDVTITVSGSTATSGIAKYQYSTDGGQSWHDMTATEKTDATATDPLNVTKAQITISGSGTADYIFRAVSNAGNESASSAPVTVKTDKFQPTIAATGDTDSYLTGDTITITADAGGSDITKVEVQAGNDSWTDITDSYLSGYTVTANGTYTFRVTNGAGVTASTSITYDNLDSVKPVVSIDSDEYISGNWTNKNVTLSVSNTAANLGTTTVQYKVDDGNWQTYNGAITVSEETDGTVYTFKAISASGVESDEVSITVKIDKTAPEGDITIEQNSVKKFIHDITFGLFFNKNVDVTITGTDNLSGVAAVEYYRSEEILTEDKVSAIGDWTVYSSISETAEDAEKFIYYVKITDEAGNTTYFGSDGATFDLTAPVIAGVTEGATYYTTQSVTVTDENFASVTVNDVVQSDSAFTLPGNVEKTYTIVATDKAGNKTTATVTMKPISSLEESIGSLTPDNVTSEDMGTVETVKEQIESIDLEDATDDEKAALQEILDKCDDLVEKIEESAQAGSTENTDKVEDITADNVKPEDKDDLTAAKEDLENALENFGDNYTEEEKAEIQNKLDQIDDALESLEKIEAVEDAISKLPDTVEPDDTDAEQLIQEAKEQYDALTEHEKSLVSEDAREKLESLLAALGDYEVVKGDGSKWEKGTDTGLVFTANGAFSKFTGIEVDGKAVDKGDYTAVSGSTVITLKPEYLETLSVGTHTLTVQYTDGEASCEFTIAEKPAEGTDNDTQTPETGDNSNMMLWIALLFVSGGVLSAVTYRKKKQTN